MPGAEGGTGANPTRGRASSTLSYSRVLVGPLAIAGFFLPWASGPGPFAATDFTGFTLVGFAGRLQALDLSMAQGGLLWAFRLAILGVALAGVWQLILAPRHRDHFGYPLSGWYIVAMAGLVTFLGLLRSGFVVPPAGLALLGSAAIVFLTALIAEKQPVLGDKQHAAE